MLRPRALALALPLLAGLAAGPALPGAALAQDAAPRAHDAHAPTAERRPVTLENHGDVRTDPYLWLRDRESPEVIAHLEAENAWFESQMAPLAGLQDELFDEIRERIPQDDASVPFRLGEHYYYRRYEDGKQYPIHARRAGSLEAPEQVLLDVNELAEGHDYYGALVGSASISPDGRLLAWAADTTGRRFYTIRFLDMTTGEMLPDAIPNVTGNLAWANDSRTLFYAKQDPETLRWDRIYRHELGTDPASAALVYTERDDTFSTFVAKTSDDHYLLIGSSHTLTSEWRVLDADDPAGEPRVFEPRERGHEYDIDHATACSTCARTWRPRTSAWCAPPTIPRTASTGRK